MGQYIIRRLLLAIPVLLVVSILIFGGVRSIPGDVCHIVLGSRRGNDERCGRIETQLGLDKPVPRSTSAGWAASSRATSGSSMTNRRPVTR